MTRAGTSSADGVGAHPLGIRGARSALLALLFAIASPGASALAQTTFEWPERAVDYSRYTHPEQCASMADRLKAAGWRGEERSKRDTLTYDPLDTLPARVVDAVRQCVANFEVKDAEPFELPWLFHLELLANRDDQMKAVVARQEALAPTPSAKADVLLGSVTKLLDAQPVRVKMAREYAARLDGMGAVAAKQRMGVHLWPFWRYAMATLDTAMMRTEHAAYEKAEADAGGVETNISLFAMIMREKVAAVLGAGAPDGRAFFRKLAATRFPDAPKARVDALIDELYGHGNWEPAGDFWFGDGASAPVHLTPGKVSFMVFVGEPCGGKCAGAYAVLRRLEERFGDKLDIILMARTMGHVRLLPPPTPAEEAELIRQYFLEDVKLADVLGVVSTPYLRLPDPDGRYIAQGTPNLQHFGYIENDGTDNDAAWGVTEGTLVGYFTGPDGEIKARSTVTVKSERVLNLLAAKLVAANGSAGRAGSSEPDSAKENAGATRSASDSSHAP